MIQDRVLKHQTQGRAPLIDLVAYQTGKRVAPSGQTAADLTVDGQLAHLSNGLRK